MAAPRPPRIVLAPDKFKGTLDAVGVAEALAEGLRAAVPAAECALVPVADGGDGTLAAAVRAGWADMPGRVSGPDGRPVAAGIGLQDDAALVELALAAGLHLAPPAPLTASTAGVGELIRLALDHGARRVVLGVGGSASTDGGSGLLTALGARFLDATGAPIGPGGAGLAHLERVELGGLDPRLAGTQFVVATDVDNPLTGPHGAAAVFAPQKGASADDVVRLEAGLRRLAGVLRRDAGVDVEHVAGAGAAGGTAAGAVAVLGARIESGAELVCDLTGLPEHLAGADLVVTGEGALDEQTLRGKAPAVVARRSAAAGVPCVAVAGVVRLQPAQWRPAGFTAAHGLTEVEPEVARCLAEPAPILAALAARLLPRYLIPSPDAPVGGPPEPHARR